MAENKRVLIVTSGGGHLDQAMCLLPALKECDILVATYSQDMTSAIEEAIPAAAVRRVAYLSKKINLLLALQLFINFFQFLRMLVFFRPHAIVSTGSEIACPAFLAAFFFPCKRIHIETVERVTSLSITGKAMRVLAQKLYVQWPQLVQKAGPKGVFAGRIC